MERERNYDNDGLDPSEEYFSKKKKGSDAFPLIFFMSEVSSN